MPLRRFKTSRLAMRWRLLWNDLRPSESTTLVLIAFVVGLGAGVGGVFFRWLIHWVHSLGFDGGKTAFFFLGNYYIILIPALGGLIVGPLIYFFAREAKGHGVPEVMEAVALRGGRIRPRVVVVKSIASAVSIGTGGSVGREGPIVQIGSAIGSTIGQYFRFGPQRIRTFVACGAAGGIAATFNAPIAGVLFALEIILQEFRANYFSLVVISSVTASVIGRAVFGDVPSFPVPEYAVVSNWEYSFYIILGLVSAAVGVGFILLLYKTEDIFDDWKFPEYLKPAIGGLMLGTMGLATPLIFGVGYEGIGQALHNSLSLKVMCGLLVYKMLATSITIGSGGSGGVFAPSLFLGAMLGGTFGAIVNVLFPEITASPGAYALVGMGAFFAATGRAPITAIIMLFEMTGDYKIILPLMLCCGLSTSTAARLLSDSIYTRKLSRRGIRINDGRDADIMDSVLVGDSMTAEIESVPTSMSVKALARTFASTSHHGFPVVDDEGKLFGIVSISDTQTALGALDVDELTVKDIATTELLVAHPDEPMSSAVRLMGKYNLGRLPVVDRSDPTYLLGMVRRSDLYRAYHVASMQQMDRENRAKRVMAIRRKRKKKV